jgi:hypothetical protein
MQDPRVAYRLRQLGLHLAGGGTAATAAAAADGPLELRPCKAVEPSPASKICSPEEALALIPDGCWLTVGALVRPGCCWLPLLRPTRRHPPPLGCPAA